MAYKIPESSEMNLPERLYVPEIIRGVAILTRHFLKNLFGKRDPAPEILARKGISEVSTVEYPEERVPYPPGYRGLHRLIRREDGEPRCVACYMCATVCPAQCIFIEAGEYPTDGKREDATIEKYPVRFEIDELRCIVCGFCVEACPKDAIRMDTGVSATAGYDRASFHLARERLLAGEPVSHPSDPWLRREGSRAPAHQRREAHTRVADPDAPEGKPRT